LSKTENN